MRPESVSRGERVDVCLLKQPLHTQLFISVMGSLQLCFSTPVPCQMLGSADEQHRTDVLSSQNCWVEQNKRSRLSPDLVLDVNGFLVLGASVSVERGSG